MKRPDDMPYLRHILDAIARIEEYACGVDQEAFERTPLVQDGVIRQIMVIGEAVKLLSEELRDRYSSIPWRDIARMRDTLIHRYFGINIQKVWLTVQDDLPMLRRQIETILLELQPQADELEGEGEWRDVGKSHCRAYRTRPDHRGDAYHAL